MNNKKNNRQFWSLILKNWWACLMPVASLFLSMIISKTQSDVGTPNTILALVFVTILSIESTFFCIIIVPKFTQEVVLPRFKETVAQPRQGENDPFLTSSIITDRQLSIMEQNCHFEEIWVVSNDLTTEMDGGLYADIVPENLRRGIKYKVFTPQNNITKMRIKTLKRKYVGIDNISFYYLTDDFFFLVSRLDFTIYDPYKNSKTGRQGYIGLDLPGSDELYEAKISDDLVDAIASKLLEYIETPKVIKIDTGT